MSKVNLNNLFNLAEDMRTLGASEQSIKLLEENIRKGSTSFEILETQKVSNGQVDIRFPIKTSDPEKGYFFTTFKAQFHSVKPLEDGQFYFLITPNAEGANEVKKFTHPLQAVDLFNKRDDKDCKLVVGTDLNNSRRVAERQGKEVVVAREYRSAFYGKPVEQTFYCPEAKGFTVPQARNMVQGRSVFRDDLVSKTGEKYMAWVNLDTEKGKTGQNFQLKTYRDPAYGFNLNEAIKDYDLKFLKDSVNQPKNLAELETALKNGDKPLVVVKKDGVNVELQLETAIRFRKLNFFTKDGTPEKREQFLTKEAQKNLEKNTQAKENSQEVSQGLER